MGLNIELSDSLARAFSLACSGEVLLAQEIVAELRKNWATELSSSVTTDLMIVEGICYSYSGDLAAAQDRLNRACLLSQIACDQNRWHLSVGWLAFVQFNSGLLDQSVTSVILAASRLSGVGLMAKFRSSVVIAILFEFVGKSELASLWFEFAQKTAPASEAGAVMSSIIYNMSALRVASGLLSRFETVPRHIDRSLDLLFVRSSINFDLLTGRRVQTSLHQLIEAQALSLMQNFEGALFAIEQFLRDSYNIPREFIAQGEFERSYYRLQLGSNFSADDLVRLQESLIYLAGDDDLAMANEIVARVCEHSGSTEQVEKYRALSRLHQCKHSLLCTAIAERLTRAGLSEISPLWFVESR
jgi:hypothetical protein